jgi:hypothetical protein
VYVRTSCCFVLRNRLDTSFRVEWRRCSPYAPNYAFIYPCTVRTYEHALHELGANVSTQSPWCVPGNSSTGNHITGRLLAAEHSSGALVPFRDSSGSHCLLRAWVKLNSHTTEARVRVHVRVRVYLYPRSRYIKWSSYRYLTIAPQPAHEHPQRTRPSYVCLIRRTHAIRALGGAQRSRRRIRSSPGKR